MARGNAKKMMGDFETTVYQGQTYTEVWASAVVQLGTEDVKIFHSIDDTFRYLESLRSDIIIYYHNLKFDGAFWLSYLMNDIGYKQAYTGDPETLEDFKLLRASDLKNGMFTHTISDMGQWYRIQIKTHGHIIDIRDSLKLLPFSVAQIGKSFATKHKKLDMEYTGFRYAGCEITQEEQHYIANDVLVVKEALEIMFEEGHDRLTIGSCCLHEFRKLTGDKKYGALFPDMYQIELDEAVYGAPNAGAYIRKAYRGGWCYLVKGKELREYKNGITADVNSLYPSMMHSESGNRYPIGMPTFWTGSEIPPEALAPDAYYFIRIETRFYIQQSLFLFLQLLAFEVSLFLVLQYNDFRHYILCIRHKPCFTFLLQRLDLTRRVSAGVLI